MGTIKCKKLSYNYKKKLSKHSFFDRMKEIMSDSKTKTYFLVISAKNLIYDYLVVIVVPYKGG